MCPYMVTAHALRYGLETTQSGIWLAGVGNYSVVPTGHLFCRNRDSRRTEGA